MSQFDVAIRTGKGDWPGCEAVPLFPSTYTVVCSPALIESGAIAEPRDLLGIPLFGRQAWWMDWFEAIGLAEEEYSPSHATDLGTQQSEVTAALMQQGAAMVTPAFFAQDLKSGHIQAPFPITRSRENGYWLVHRSGAGAMPNVRDFARWLVDQSSREQSRS